MIGTMERITHSFYQCESERGEIMAGGSKRRLKINLQIEQNIFLERWANIKEPLEVNLRGFINQVGGNLLRDLTAKNKL